MVRTKTTKRKRPDPLIMQKIFESKNSESTSTRVPPTASNRKRLATERQLESRQQKEMPPTEREENLEDERASEYNENSGSDEGTGSSSGGEGEHNYEIVEREHDDEDRQHEEREGDVEKNNEEEHIAAGNEEDERAQEEVVEELVRKNSKKKGKRAQKEATTQPSEIEHQPSLLFAFKDHIAHEIWNSKEPRGAARIVKVHTHVGTQRLWDYRKECSFVQDVVVNSGLHQLVLHAHEKLDKVLINSFVERFYPETNTFHLPFGEMGITIDEVVHMTGLPAEGRAVTGPLGGSRGISYHDVYKLLDECLGLDQPTSVLVLAGDKKIRLEFLRSEFAGSKESDSDERKKHSAIAYLLYTIGCLLCCDKSGNKVSVHFLQCLKDLKEVGSYSWATACLSWLLRNLGQTTRKDVHQMTGCMTLLQVWIYEHFPSLKRHNRCVGVVEGDIRAAFYFAKEMGTHLASDLVTIRETIDDLQKSEIIWDCFKDKRQAYPFQQCSLYNGPLICFETEELYLPQRFLRQFGYVQPIPTTPFTINNKKFKSTPRGYKAAYNNLGDFSWSEWRNHLLNESLTSRRVVHPWDCDVSYMDWYKKASHPLVTNPKKRITEPIHVSDPKPLLDRIKRRLRHVADFIRSCAPNDSMMQVLEKVERIEDAEPSELYGETQPVEEHVGKQAPIRRGKGKRVKKVAHRKKGGSSK